MAASLVALLVRTYNSSVLQITHAYGDVQRSQIAVCIYSCLHQKLCVSHHGHSSDSPVLTPEAYHCVDFYSDEKNTAFTRKALPSVYNCPVPKTLQYYNSYRITR